MTASHKLVLLLAVLGVLFVATNAAPISLQKLNLEDKITVSGLSSGAYMAVQMHVSHSKSINGSAIFAGGPFYCAESNVELAQYKCMTTTLGTPDTLALVELTKTDATLGYVDDPSNLDSSKVYLFSGKLDSVVEQTVMKSLESYYKSFITNDPTTNILTDYNLNAEHCMPTIDFKDGEDCDLLSSPYLGKCSYDGAGKALQHIYGGNTNTPLNQPILVTDPTLGSNLYPFDQTPYFMNNGLNSIGDIGYIYIPTSCSSSNSNATKLCRLHVSFHGCEQNMELIGNDYAAHSGYNQWAETNNIVVLYPYAAISRTIPYNPKGCWDWWGFTGVLYGTKQGVQMKFVQAMVAKLGIVLTK